MAEARHAYREHTAAADDVPLFSQSWLLDTLVPESWGAALVRDKSGHITGSWPFTYRRVLGQWVSTTPNLIPRLGPWLDRSAREGTTPKALSRRHRVVGDLADQLPKFAHFSQSWNPEVGDWLPMHWRGYQQSTYYTYRVELEDGASLWARLDGSVRTEVRKASERHRLSADRDGSVERFLDLNQMVFERQGIPVPYSRADVTALARACSRHAQIGVVMTRDPEGHDHAGTLVVADENCAYYLLGGADPQLRSSGAGYLALWTAMQAFTGRAKVFDFEGSMLRPIERVFRLFGTAQVPYHSISRTPSRLLRTALAARGRQG